MNKFWKNIFNISSTSGSRNIYLDNAGATTIDREVILAMREVENLYANPSGIYRRGVEAKNKIEVSRKIISSILNCNNSEIIFTGSGTESINLALLGYVKNYLAASVASSVVPKVITSNVEHSAVLETLLHLEKENLIEIIFLKVDETGKVKENDLRERLKDSGPENKNNIILVSMMYANNETGRVQPVKEIGRIIDEYNRTNNQNLSFHIDAMQAGNYLDLDIKKLRCHIFSMNGSKIYGPKGIGLLYKNKDIKLSSIIYGGGQEGGIRSGTEDVQKIVGLACAMQIAKEKRDSEIIRILELQNYFFKNIELNIPEVKIYTEKNNTNKIVDNKDNLQKINYFNIESLPNNINIGLPSMLSDEMVVRLDYAGFDVSHKSACASNETGEGSYVLRAMGATEKESNENIRITMGRDTKLKDLQKLIQEIKNIYLKYKS
jgi:cysteine desulfurase